jgi:hypothetical protein
MGLLLSVVCGWGARAYRRGMRVPPVVRDARRLAG